MNLNNPQSQSLLKNYHITEIHGQIPSLRPNVYLYYVFNSYFECFWNDVALQLSKADIYESKKFFDCDDTLDTFTPLGTISFCSIFFNALLRVVISCSEILGFNLITTGDFKGDDDDDGTVGIIVFLV